ncbi:MAG: helix-turn-helix domain-containing protein [Thermoanaerobaculia bacterium]|nr:helix-turn-helix domain-containing protein [Thermoanaerobaculia bacterium]
MARRTAPVLPSTLERLRQLGSRLMLARKRRRLTAKLVAARAGMSPMTLRSLEMGGAGVTMGAYLAVMQALGVEKDLDLLVQADPLGRELQDSVSKTGRRLSRRSLAHSSETLEGVQGRASDRVSPSPLVEDLTVQEPLRSVAPRVAGLHETAIEKPPKEGHAPNITATSRSTINSPASRLRQTTGSSAVEQIRQALENSPIEQLKRAIENSPVEQMRRAIEDSPLNQLQEALRNSSVEQLRRAIEAIPSEQISREVSTLVETLREASLPAQHLREALDEMNSKTQALSYFALDTVNAQRAISETEFTSSKDLAALISADLKISDGEDR